MKAYIIAIGDELLSGRTLDTNSQFLTYELDLIGISVLKINIISDNNEVITEELTKAFETDADFIFTTGGLGPTKDDKTKQAISDFFNDTLVMHQPSLDFIKEIYCRNGRIMNDLTKNQALVPSQSQVIVNRYGTAPVLWTTKNNKVLVNLPGVPYETRAMVKEFIIPKIKNEYKLDYILHRAVNVINFPESELAITLSKWEDNLPDLMSLSYLPGESRIELRLTSQGKNREIIEKQLTNEINKLPAILGNKLLLSQKEDIQQVIISYLIKNNLNLSVSESITGGMISETITSVPGSSKYFKGGIISYQTETKENLLNIPAKIIEQHTVVSEEVAKEMALQTSQIFKSDVAISTTGVAGPDTDKYNNPIGLAYIGLYFQGEIIVNRYSYPNLTRHEMIKRITAKAFEMLYFKIIAQ
ncbi:CinA family nicotinamide mononucleotide deamidase-related protein [Apibacter sp. HY039]|uniref:CinA family nicotinamide mononucleotide deamidase-related protein n=1 Tax=Apibacter sp. HY039 TaxID=2501476 RepID=UPI000FEB5EB1|nr:CinA family nicotinamide mononucleotide deamidase-related protein [Apibacter sp. HY039]